MKNIGGNFVSTRERTGPGAHSHYSPRTWPRRTHGGAPGPEPGPQAPVRPDPTTRPDKTGHPHPTVIRSTRIPHSTTPHQRQSPNVSGGHVPEDLAAPRKPHTDPNRTRTNPQIGSPPHRPKQSPRGRGTRDHNTPSALIQAHPHANVHTDTCSQCVY